VPADRTPDVRQRTLQGSFSTHLYHNLLKLNKLKNRHRYRIKDEQEQINEIRSLTNLKRNLKMKATAGNLSDYARFYIWIIIAPMSYFATTAFFFTGL
jgi:hypothetical protein